MNWIALHINAFWFCTAIAIFVGYMILAELVARVFWRGK